MGRRARAAWATGLGALVAGAACVAGAQPAAADVVEPPGACTGTGTWVAGGFTESSADHEQSDVIEVPIEDTVEWFGAVGDAQLGDEVERRDISGEVEIALPFGSVVIDSWDGSSIRAANAGTHDYDLPDFVIGIEMTLSGEHRERGEVVCAGQVGMVVEGDPTDNPLAFVGIGGMIVFFAGMLFSGFARFTQVGPTFEDVNPG